MPAWLAQHIETATGAPVGSRRARARSCRDCHAYVLAGQDNDITALDVRADPIPLSMVGEAIAQLDGRATYALRRRGSGVVLYRRDRWQIGRGARRDDTGGGGPGRFREFDVVADHVCGQPLLELSVPSVIPTPRPPKETSDDRPPF